MGESVMTSGFAFPDVDRLFTGTDLDPAVAARSFAAFARSERDALIKSGQASPIYETYVNNRAGVPEESVQLPGPIVYVFANWKILIETALGELKKRIRSKSGKYAGSFLVVVNNTVVSDYSAIAGNAEVIILNHQPYTRKMESGGNTSGARHFDLTKAALNRRFYPAFQAQLIYLNVAGGLHQDMPYILKTGGKIIAAKQNRKSSAFRAGRATLSRRKDRKAGMPITYPALIINSAI